MKSFSILLSSLFIVIISFGQQAKQPDNNKVQALKIGYITDKLNLTETEAEKFWPIYKKYDTELKNIRQENFKDKSDVVANEEKLLKLRKKYQTDFTKAISEEKVKQFFQAEKEFNERVQNEFKRRVENRSDRPVSGEQRLRGKNN